MHPSIKALSQQAVQLPPQERLALVEQLLDSLDKPDPSIDGLWSQEAEDRLTAYRDGKLKAVSLADALAKYPTPKNA